MSGDLSKLALDAAERGLLTVAEARVIVLRELGLPEDARSEDVEENADDGEIVLTLDVETARELADYLDVGDREAVKFRLSHPDMYTVQDVLEKALAE